MTIMRDRDIVQLGIGSLPSACVAAMADAGFKDLGIHTEMLNFGLIKLIESGQVTNRYKSLPRPGQERLDLRLPRGREVVLRHDPPESEPGRLRHRLHE